MAHDPLVTFLIAGVQKAGTTALYDYLAEQGGVALSKTKEVHFFDDEGEDWRTPDYQGYESRFARAEGLPCGEATPIYTYWPNALERAAAYNPALRLVVVLRDPVERAWSHWRMEYARGAEREPFARCIREGRQRLFDSQPWGHHREFSYVERGFYGEQVERLFALFPRDQVLLLRAEDLRADARRALATVRAFIGAAPAPAPVARDVHVGVDMDYGSELTVEDADYLRALYARDQARLADLTGFSFA
jgi:hypothetical protein